MTGSGSTLFAVYRSAKERDEARLTLNPKLGQLLSVETLAQAPPS